MALTPPTGDRMIVLYDQPAMLRGRTVSPRTLAWPAKDPTEFLTYAADFGPLIQSGATVAAMLPGVSDQTVSIGARGVSGTVALLELGGGTDGTTVTVAVRVMLSSGEILARSIWLPIVAQPGVAALGAFGTSPPVTGYRLTDPKTGQNITDPVTGLPITLPSLPGAQIGLIDPASGLAIVDPATGLPLAAVSAGSTAQTGSSAVTTSAAVTQSTTSTASTGTGSTSTALTYNYPQQVAESVWSIQHNLNSYPAIVVIDTAGDYVEGSINYDSLNHVTITFSVPLSGIAYLS